MDNTDSEISFMFRANYAGETEFPIIGYYNSASDWQYIRLTYSAVAANNKVELIKSDGVGGTTVCWAVDELGLEAPATDANWQSIVIVDSTTTNKIAVWIASAADPSGDPVDLRFTSNYSRLTPAEGVGYTAGYDAHWNDTEINIGAQNIDTAKFSIDELRINVGAGVGLSTNTPPVPNRLKRFDEGGLRVKDSAGNLLSLVAEG